MKKNQKIKKSKKNKTTTEIVVRVQNDAQLKESDLAPIQENSKFKLPQSWISEKQIIQLVQKTPPQYVYKRPGRGGQIFSYVQGHYIEKVLNFIFGWNWDFETMSTEEKHGQVIVRGKLTVKDDKGHSITKMQTGRAEIKFLKGTKTPVDYGNDEKAATTDSLKKCASLLGIASDIYGKNEVKQETGKEVLSNVVPQGNNSEDHSQEQFLKKGQIIGPDGSPTYVCAVCADPISDQVAEFSMKTKGRRLCREHQSNK